MMLPVMNMNEIAKRLYDAIIERRISYGELSRITGVPKSAMDRLLRLSAALGLPASALAPWDGADAREQSAEELPEITMIARAGKKMSPERRQDMLRLLQIAFPEEFRDADGI